MRGRPRPVRPPPRSPRRRTGRLGPPCRPAAHGPGSGTVGGHRVRAGASTRTGQSKEERGQAAGVVALPCCDLGAASLPFGPQPGQGTVYGSARAGRSPGGRRRERQQRRQVGIAARDGVRNVEEQGARLGVRQGIDAGRDCPAGWTARWPRNEASKRGRGWPRRRGGPRTPGRPSHGVSRLSSTIKTEAAPRPGCGVGNPGGGWAQPDGLEILRFVMKRDRRRFPAAKQRRDPKRATWPIGGPRGVWSAWSCRCPRTEHRAGIRYTGAVSAAISRFRTRDRGRNNGRGEGLLPLRWRVPR